MNNIFEPLYIEEVEKERTCIKQKIHFDNIILEKFLKQDPIFVENIIPKIRQKLQLEEFKNHIVSLEKKKLQRQLNALDNNSFSKLDIASSCFLKARILKINFESLSTDGNNIYSETIKPRIDPHNNDSFWKDNYIIYWVVKLLYDEYILEINIQNEFKVPNDENNLFFKFYLEKNIDLIKEDNQYKKYKLFTINKTMQYDELKNIRGFNTPLQVYDIRVKEYLSIHNAVTPLTITMFFDLMNAGHIPSFAIRPNYFIVPSVFNGMQYSTEEKIFGNVFSFAGLECPCVNKFYTTDYRGLLWIYHDNENITFEEINTDHVETDNIITTQVIHLMFFKENNRYFIKHIDHEYIFYTNEQFQLKHNDPYQKGDARPRFKTFKIDEAKIPFENINGEFFLYKILDQYFEHTQLLKEYFNKILTD